MHMGGFSNNVSAERVYREKREVPRFTFIASVVITELTTQTRISGRISEISRKGCYVDVLNTLPVGTPIHITISRDSGTFATLSKVIYVQEGMGMGVAYDATAPDQLQILDSWLAELAA
jgi:PilZ domain